MLGNDKVIDSLQFEVAQQELEGSSGAGTRTAIRMTSQGRCGWIFTFSYECSASHIRCS